MGHRGRGGGRNEVVAASKKGGSKRGKKGGGGFGERGRRRGAGGQKRLTQEEGDTHPSGAAKGSLGVPRGSSGTVCALRLRRKCVICFPFSLSTSWASDRMTAPSVLPLLLPWLLLQTRDARFGEDEKRCQ